MLSLNLICLLNKFIIFPNKILTKNTPRSLVRILKHLKFFFKQKIEKKLGHTFIIYSIINRTLKRSRLRCFTHLLYIECKQTKKKIIRDLFYNYFCLFFKILINYGKIIHHFVDQS